MICSWRWFIQPATAISTNLNESRTLSILLAHYREHHLGPLRTRANSADLVSGPYAVPFFDGLPFHFDNRSGFAPATATRWSDSRLDVRIQHHECQPPVACNWRWFMN